jgi:hypothetical protein
MTMIFPAPLAPFGSLDAPVVIGNERSNAPAP